MNKRYWFVVIDVKSPFYDGKANLGYISDDENPFNNESIKLGFIENNPQIKPGEIAVINFIEFKSEEDYKNFWKK